MFVESSSGHPMDHGRPPEPIALGDLVVSLQAISLLFDAGQVEVPGAPAAPGAEGMTNMGRCWGDVGDMMGIWWGYDVGCGLVGW